MSPLSGLSGNCRLGRHSHCPVAQPAYPIRYRCSCSCHDASPGTVEDDQVDGPTVSTCMPGIDEPVPRRNDRP